MFLERSAYLSAIGHRLADYPVVALPGPRQVGKTTLARLYAESRGDQPTHFFDLESPSDLARLNNPELVVFSIVNLGGRAEP